MSYETIPLKPFQKFYAQRTEVEKDVIDSKIELLKINPFDNRNLDIKKLKGYEQRYRLRIWNYRIFYEVYSDKLIIIVIDGGNRGDVYK